MRQPFLAVTLSFMALWLIGCGDGSTSGPKPTTGHFGWQTESSATAAAATFAATIIPSRCSRKCIHRTNGHPASFVIHDARRVQAADSQLRASRQSGSPLVWRCPKPAPRAH